MAAKQNAMSEKMYVCEVQRRRIRSSGRPGYEFFWKVKNVHEALADGDTVFRCQSCYGALKVLKRTGANGTQSHVEHKLRRDSEYCPAGGYFAQAADGREPRLSESPVM